MTSRLHIGVHLLFWGVLATGCSRSNETNLSPVVSDAATIEEVNRVAREREEKTRRAEESYFQHKGRGKGH